MVRLVTDVLVDVTEVEKDEDTVVEVVVTTDVTVFRKVVVVIGAGVVTEATPTVATAGELTAKKPRSGTNNSSITVKWRSTNFKPITS